MKPPLPIPPKTRWELDHPAPPGQRHDQIKRVACSLAGRGFNPGDIAGLLRPRYGPDVPDREIAGLASWAVRRFGGAGESLPSLPPTLPSLAGGYRHPSRTPQLAPEIALPNFLRGFEASESELWEASPVPLADDWREDCPLFLASLYFPADRVNLVTGFSQEGGKARPFGRGKILSCREWLAEIHREGVPQGAAGAWIRMNPLSGDGISDADVGKFRFALLECDGISLPLQIALFARLPIPIAAIVSSGGRSLHAWVWVNAPNAESYRATVGDMFAWLTPLGIDPANRNPSRLARLPGVQRALGGSGDCRQRLLYLNPNANACKAILP